MQKCFSEMMMIYKDKIPFIANFKCYNNNNKNKLPLHMKKPSLQNIEINQRFQNEILLPSKRKTKVVNITLPNEIIVNNNDNNKNRLSLQKEHSSGFLPPLRKKSKNNKEHCVFKSKVRRIGWIDNNNNNNVSINIERNLSNNCNEHKRSFSSVVQRKIVFDKFYKRILKNKTKKRDCSEYRELPTLTEPCVEKKKKEDDIKVIYNKGKEISSVFKSKTNKGLYEYHTNVPGPCYYEPKKIGCKSFFKNVQKIWI